ncbi:hypothetical protein Adt_07205 [Abeliophyllum distichum]|uniref:Uncharacterized protein n=1 Tax=Abeliophyllum distichum TaxID=126358 RepID=A0ABD1V961_9LAMI
MHPEGIFYDKPNNVAYEGGVVLFFDFFYPEWFTRDNLTLFLWSLDMDVLLDFYYRRPRMSLGQGLRRLESEDNVRYMFIDIGGGRVVEVYIVRAVQSHALPLVPNEEVPATVDEQAICEYKAFEGSKNVMRVTMNLFELINF